MDRPKRSREVRVQEGRTRVLEAARELFNAEGVEGLSIRAIARRAGMPAMTLYSYYPSKMAIVRGLWAEAFAPLFVELDAAEASEPDPKGRLKKVAQAMVDYWMRHPDRYKVIFLIPDRRESEDDRWFIEETDVVAAYLRFGPLIAAARGDPTVNCAREAEALLCALTGVVHMLVGIPEYPWATSATYVDLILKAFC